MSEQELLSLFLAVKREDEIPALVTSQINEIGDFGYSSYGLNQRLKGLHEDGLLGHQKAANRHMWWLSNEGTTDEVDLSSLQNLIDVDELDPEMFDEEKAREIASVSISDFEKNWWERISISGDQYFRIGTIPFIVSLSLLMIAPSVLPTGILEGLLLLGIVFIFIAGGHYALGNTGGFLASRTRFPDEPWGGSNLKGLLYEKYRE